MGALPTQALVDIPQAYALLTYSPEQSRIFGNHGASIAAGSSDVPRSSW
jgi:hypothetical protein